MKAQIENGKIRIINELPVIHKNILGFNKCNPYTYNQYGFYDVIKPQITDHTLQKYGEPYFDNSIKAVVFPIVDIELPLLEEVRMGLKLEFKSLVGEVINSYNTASMLNGNDPDLGIAALTARQKLRSIRDEMKSITDIRIALKYKIKQEDRDYLINLFEPFLF